MRDLFLALMFYTRIPTPAIKDFQPEDANKTLRCYSLVGAIVGIIYWAAFAVGDLVFNTPMAIVLAFGAGALATGCFHEDGFADMVDGFGGGTDKQRILDIMKDSRIGTYGTIATILMYAMKFLALLTILTSSVIDRWWLAALIFVCYHSLARMTAGSMVFFSRYSRDDGTSKVKPVEKAWTWREMLGLYSFGMIPFVICIALCPWCALTVAPLVLLFTFFKLFYEKKIDGYTGDCLGALEQMCELVILLSFVVILKFAF
ncbi:MAG: adenosylcobinamide-GDP ribazoletransferase [Bacteroidales bacterium]|nr:adenosylcobinamide-GDP ribazoletransferase [Bacteroidales bacterium]